MREGLGKVLGVATEEISLGDWELLGSCWLSDPSWVGMGEERRVVHQGWVRTEGLHPRDG